MIPGLYAAHAIAVPQFHPRWANHLGLRAQHTSRDAAWLFSRPGMEPRG